MAASELRNEHLKGVGKYTLACSDTAGKIAARAGVKRLVLTHFKRMEPALLDVIAEDVRRDYAGPVSLANDLDEIEFLLPGVIQTPPGVEQCDNPYRRVVDSD